MARVIQFNIIREEVMFIVYSIWNTPRNENLFYEYWQQVFINVGMLEISQITFMQFY